MNKIIIRPTIHSDLPGICDLFSGNKTIEELNWLLHDFTRQGKYRSFVAIQNEIVVGHIGYLTSSYTYKEHVFSGVHNMLWLMAPGIRGFHGLKLIRETMLLGDFSFAIGASRYSASIFPQIGYQFKFRIPLYLKFLSPLKIPSRKITPPLVTAQSPGKDGFRPQNGSFDVARNSEQPSHLSWVMQSPFLEKTSFILKLNGEHIGIVVCFINKHAHALKTGRIVHISWLGDDPLIWNAALELCEDFFRKKNCYLISIPASADRVKRVLKNRGYFTHDKLRKPFYLCNEKGLLPAVPDSDWHLTFLESDLCYRNV